MDIDKWIEQVAKCNILPEASVKKLCRKVKTLLFEESNVQPVQSPVTICGDLHGQFYDVLELFEKGGWPPNTRYLFLGDYVDRGYHSVEVITLLFCFKVKYPDRIVLLRGNHQSRSITYNYGFYQQINRKYGNQSVWTLFNQVFDYMPLGAIVEGQIFCVHGGLTPYMNSIDHIRSIERNIQIPIRGAFCDLMWSDPEQSIDDWKANDRGAGWIFGKKVVDEFINTNGLKFIARAHQLVKDGFKQQFDKKLVTVWSAPNYCYRQNNLAAIMKIDDNDKPTYIVYEASPQSAKSENYRNLLPYFL